MQIVTAVVRQVFTYGSVLDSREIFLRILNAPAIRELAHDAGRNNGKGPKHWRSVEQVIDNVRNYLTKILYTKGSRTTVDQRAYRTVMAALSGENIVKSKSLMLVASLLVSVTLCCYIIFFQN